MYFHCFTLVNPLCPPLPFITYPQVQPQLFQPPIFYPSQGEFQAQENKNKANSQNTNTMMTILQSPEDRP